MRIPFLLAAAISAHVFSCFPFLFNLRVIGHCLGNFISIYFWPCWSFTATHLLSLQQAGTVLCDAPLLIVVAPPTAELGSQALGLSRCGAWARLLLGMWNLPRPGIEPFSLGLGDSSHPLFHQVSPVFSFLIRHFMVCQAAHSRVPAWRIPWTEEPGGLQSLGSQT